MNPPGDHGSIELARASKSQARQEGKQRINKTRGVGKCKQVLHTNSSSSCLTDRSDTGLESKTGIWPVLQNIGFGVAPPAKQSHQRTKQNQGVCRMGAGTSKSKAIN